MIIKKMMTETFIMVSVDNKTAPFGTVENMERSIRHADVKSGALKKTQVTLMRKKVSSARMKFEDSTFFKNLGAIYPCTTTSFFDTSSGIGFSRTLKSCISFSTHK